VGRVVLKAVDYLVKSGEKSLRRCAVEEAHAYYQEAFALLAEKPSRSAQEDRLLVDILIRWFFVYNVRGLFNAMIALLREHAPLAERAANPSQLAMYCCCMGWALQRREALEESHAHLIKAMTLAQSCGDQRALAYASGCLIWTCTDLGRLEEAIEYGAKAREACRGLETDQELLRINLTGLGVAHWFRGESRHCRDIGRQLLAYGEQGGDIRSTSDGYLVCAMGRFAAGDFHQTIDYCQKAVRASVGLVHSLNSKFLLGYAYLSAGKVEAAETTLEEIVRFAGTHGYEYLGSSAQALSALVDLAKGGVGAGVRTIRRHMEAFRAGGKRYHYLTFEYLLGRVYLQIALRQGAFSLPQVLRNLAFLAVALPKAGRMAEHHLEGALGLAGDIGARGIAGQAHLDLALLWKARKALDRAREHAAAGIRLFAACEADVFLAQARTLLAALPGGGNDAHKAESDRH
jgi:tetratricopeptide (TPR) repeat protein